MSETLPIDKANIDKANVEYLQLANKALKDISVSGAETERVLENVAIQFGNITLKTMALLGPVGELIVTLTALAAKGIANMIDSAGEALLKVDAINDVIIRVNNARKEGWGDTTSEIANLREKADRYEELRTKIQLTNNESAELLQITRELDGVLPQGTSLIDEQTGAYTALADTIVNVTKAIEKQGEINSANAGLAQLKAELEEYQKYYDMIEAEFKKQIEEPEGREDWAKVIASNDEIDRQMIINRKNTIAEIMAYEKKFGDNTELNWVQIVEVINSTETSIGESTKAISQYHTEMADIVGTSLNVQQSQTHAGTEIMKRAYAEQAKDMQDRVKNVEDVWKATQRRYQTEIGYTEEQMWADRNAAIKKYGKENTEEFKNYYYELAVEAKKSHNKMLSDQETANRQSATIREQAIAEAERAEREHLAEAERTAKELNRLEAEKAAEIKKYNDAVASRTQAILNSNTVHAKTAMSSEEAATAVKNEQDKIDELKNSLERLNESYRNGDIDSGEYGRSKIAMTEQLKAAEQSLTETMAESKKTQAQLEIEAAEQTLENLHNLLTARKLLLDKGFDESELGEMSNDQIAAMANATDEEIEKYRALIAECKKAAENLAENELSEMKKDTDESVLDIQKKIDGLSLGESISTEVMTGLKTGFEGMEDDVISVVSAIASNISSLLEAAGKVNLYVETGAPYVNGAHEQGLDYVPFDNYMALLHKGERVMTAQENQGAGQKTANLTMNIYGNTADRYEILRDAEDLLRMGGMR